MDVKSKNPLLSDGTCRKDEEVHLGKLLIEKDCRCSVDVRTSRHTDGLYVALASLCIVAKGGIERQNS